MACLYIDRLKSNFQRGHHFEHTNNRETWCPRLSINRLRNYKSELCYTSEGPSSISVAAKFNPIVPKVFTIGLHSNYRKMNNDHLSIFTVKDLLKRYLDNVIRRYRSYSRTSSKLTPNETCNQNMCSFHSLVCIVSKCSKEFAKNIWDISKRKDHATVRCKCQESCDKVSHDSNTLKNIVEPNDLDKRYDQANKDNHKVTTTTIVKKRTHYTGATNTAKSEVRSSLTTERVVDYAVSSARSNASGDACPGSLTSRKKDISVQTSRTSRSHRKDHRKTKTKNNRKEHGTLTSTDASSKDIETIFRTNSADFNRKESKLSLDLSRTRYLNEASPNRKKKIERKSRSSKLTEQTETTRETLPRIYRKFRKRDRSVLREVQNTLTSESRNVNTLETLCNRMKFEGNESPLKCEEKCFISDTIETVFDRSASRRIVTVSRVPRNYRVEDKTSEIMILGNIKKRLEKDYDDYFSFDEFEVENSALDYHEIKDTSEPNALMIKEPVTKREGLKCSNFNSTRNTNCKKSIEANLTYSFSVHCTNSDLSHSRSSYHTPLREQDDSQCSSVEYCSASNESSSNVSRVKQHFNSSMDPRSFSKDFTYNYAIETLPDDRIFRIKGEYSDQTINLDAMQLRHHSNSTPNLSNSSKLITESLDSGVLTDYSRDLLSSNERLRKTNAISPVEFDCSARELNLLETYDFNTDSSFSDESLDRRVDVAVRKFTEDLALAERKTRLKLRRLENPSKCAQRKRQRSRRQVKEISMYAAECNSSCNSSCNFNAFYWSHDDDKITGCSSPPFSSFSDSEIDQIDHT